MCWNVSSSLAGFLWGSSVGLYVCHVRQKSVRDVWLGSFLIIFSLVQLCEAALWQWGEVEPSLFGNETYQRQTECNRANQMITGYILPAVLVFEITSQCMRAYMYWHDMKTASWKLIAMAVLWTVLGVQYRYPKYVASRPLCSTSYTDGNYLLWGDVPYSFHNRGMTAHFLLGTFGIGLPFWVIRKCGWMYASFTIGSSFMVYYLHTPTWASHWCFVALGGSLLVLLDPWLFDIPTSDLVIVEEKKPKRA